jgi:DegV family protein with EDD domain
MDFPGNRAKCGAGNMTNVAVITDSTCCLPADLVRQHDIHVLPMVINYSGKSYQDGIDITPSEIYRIMRKNGELPTTSTLSPGTFLKAFLECSKLTSEIFCVTLTSLQSKTYETAIVARDIILESMPKLKIEVFDSRSVGGALGFIVLEAAREAYIGASLDRVLQRAIEMQGKVDFLAMLDTLYYLAKSGRLALAAHWAASLLQLKPILEHNPDVGQTAPVTRPRTTEKALEKMKEIIASRVDGRKIHMIVHHADALDQAQKFRESMANQFQCVENYLTEFTPVMGVHTGPGLIGISYYAE